MRRVGVLGFQGCITPHLKHLKKLGCESVLVRTRDDLLSSTHLILPGGESTTMLRFLEREGMREDLARYVREHPVWGVCAGAILLAAEVTNPRQFSFGAAPFAAHRNFYGSQLDSFSAQIEVSGRTHTVDFIRAPRLVPLESSIEVLARRDEEAVLLRSGNLLISSFHTELRDDAWMHELLIAGG